jgi:hypothetical protein
MFLRGSLLILIVSSCGMVHGREPQPRERVPTIAAPLTLRKLVDFATAIPQGTGTFVEFGDAALQASEVVFQGRGTADQLGIYKIDTQGAVTSIIRRGDPAPGVDADFFDFTLTPPLIDQGDIVFAGFYSSPATFGYGVYRSRNGVLTRLVDSQQSIPGGGLQYSNIFTFDYRQESLVFAALRSDFSQGVYRRNPAGVITELATTGSPSPLGGSYTDFGFSGSQDGVALRGAETWFVAASGDPGRTGVFATSSGGLVTIAAQNGVVPGGGATFVGPTGAVANSQQGAFVDRNRGIFRQQGAGPLSTMVGTTTPIPDAGALRFTTFGQPTIDAAATYAFSGRSERIFGLFFLQTRGVGVYLDQGMGLQSVVRGADQLAFQFLGGPIPLWNSGGDRLDGERVLTVRVGPRGLDGGQLVLHVTFVNGTQALYLATSPTP